MLHIGNDTCDQWPDGVALNCGVYDMSLKNDQIDNYTHDTNAKQKQLLKQALTYMNTSFPPAYVMTSVNDGLRPCTMPMKKKLETLEIPFVYAEYGEGMPSDGHVFHLNLYSENGKRCNQAEADFLHGLIQE